MEVLFWNYLLLFGDFECLKAAVQNGADSVYFGANSFSARAYAHNFNLEELKQSIHYAKLRNVHTHLTLNTLLKDSELEEAITLASKAYEFGIDAIIVQDLGLAKTLMKYFPDLPLHASTQMTAHNLEGVLALENLGFKRVVLSRELSLEEIEYIKSHCKVEIEVFAHGALCMSYSGQCLFSSMIGGRSGNRGKCAQPCRLPYDLLKQDKNGKETVLDKGYLLSPRDLCSLELLPNLINANIDCLKIEGRMKSPEYVATVTRIYRKYLDLALQKDSYQVQEEDKKDLLQIFNRGGFSTGHLKNSPNKSLVDTSKPNNTGILIGYISNYNKEKGHITLTLLDSLEIGDTVSFEKESSKYTVSELMKSNSNRISESSGSTVTIGRMKGNIRVGDKVYKMASKALLKQAQMTFNDKTELKKIPLSATITLQKEKPVLLTICPAVKPSNIYYNLMVSVQSEEVPVLAKNQPIDKERICSQLSKTSNTPYEFSKIEVKLEPNLFLPNIRILNELRRKALSKLENLVLEKIERKNKYPIVNVPENQKASIGSDQISLFFTRFREDLDYEKIENVDRICLPFTCFMKGSFKTHLQDLTNSHSVYVVLPTIIRENFQNLISTTIDQIISSYPIKGFVISNIQGISMAHKLNTLYPNRFEFIANYTLNVFNSVSANELRNLNIHTVTISPELDKETILSLCSSVGNFSELMVYGNLPVMNANYCLLGKTNQCLPTCPSFCTEDTKYYLKDRLGFYFRLLPNRIQTTSTILNSKTLSISPKEFPCASYRIQILDEDLDQINHIIQVVKNKDRFEGKEYTNGNLNREI